MSPASSIERKPLLSKTNGIQRGGAEMEQNKNYGENRGSEPYLFTSLDEDGEGIVPAPVLFWYMCIVSLGQGATGSALASASFFDRHRWPEKPSTQCGVNVCIIYGIYICMYRYEGRVASSGAFYAGNRTCAGT